MSHTPGPWIATKAGPLMAGYSQGDAIASIDQTTLIAGCFSDVRGGPAVAEANARLIAAAPDLLQACESLLGALRDAGKGDDRYTNVLNNAMNAIAKAKAPADREALERQS